jgi:hypothetical protein
MKKVNKEIMVFQKQKRTAKITLDAAFEFYSCLGPGMLECTRQTCLHGELKEGRVLMHGRSKTLYAEQF